MIKPLNLILLLVIAGWAFIGLGCLIDHNKRNAYLQTFKFHITNGVGKSYYTNSPEIQDYNVRFIDQDGNLDFICGSWTIEFTDK